MRKSRWLILTAGAMALFFLFGAVSCSEPVDTDGDGWSDGQETRAGTNPEDADTDGDGYWDPYDSNPLDATVTGEAPPPVTPAETDPEAPPETPATTTPTPPPPPQSIPLSPEAATAQELRKVQSAVTNMMRNNGLSELPNPVQTPTSDMHRFPDAASKHGPAGIGYVIFLHDFNGDGSPDVNYFHARTTSGTYTCDEFGTVTQITTGYD